MMSAPSGGVAPISCHVSVDRGGGHPVISEIFTGIAIRHNALLAGADDGPPCITGQDLLSALHGHVVVCPSSGAAVICQILGRRPPFDRGSITVTTAQDRHFAGPTVQVLGYLPLPSVCFIHAVERTSTDPPYYDAWLPTGHPLCHFFLQFKVKDEMSSVASGGQTDLTSLLPLPMSAASAGTQLGPAASYVDDNLLDLLMDTPTVDSLADFHPDPPFPSISVPDVETQPGLEPSHLLTPTNSYPEYSLPPIIDLDALWGRSEPSTPCCTDTPISLTPSSPVSDNLAFIPSTSSSLTPYPHPAGDAQHLPPVGPSDESIAALCASLVPDYTQVSTIARFAAGKKNSGLVTLAQSFFAMEHILESLRLEPKRLETSQKFHLAEEETSTWNGSQVILQFGWSSTTFTNKYRMYSQARKMAAGTWKNDVATDGTNKSLYDIFCCIQYLWGPGGPLDPMHRFVTWKPPHNAPPIPKSAGSLSEKSLKVNMRAIRSNINL